MSNLKLVRYLFLFAAVFGLIMLLPQFFMEEKNGRDFPPPITHAEYYYGFLGVAVAWQVLFLVLATDPIRYRPMMIPSILEKVSFGITCIVLYFQSRLAPMLFGAGLLDLVFAALFFVAYLRTPQTKVVG